MSRSEVFQYQTAGDSTLGAPPAKREHSPDDTDGAAHSAAKRIKLEYGAENVSDLFMPPEVF